MPSVGNGLNTATAPVWQTETSPTRWRGKLVVLEMMMNIFGFMLVNWINYGLSFVGGALAWRLPLALQFAFIVVLFATVPWLPESPRWLLAHARVDEATLILADLQNRAPSDPHVVAARDEILFSVRYERENAVRWRDLARGRGEGGTKTMRRLLLGMGSQVSSPGEAIPPPPRRSTPHSSNTPFPAEVWYPMLKSTDIGLHPRLCNSSVVSIS